MTITIQLPAIVSTEPASRCDKPVSPPAVFDPHDEPKAIVLNGRRSQHLLDKFGVFRVICCKYLVQAYWPARFLHPVDTGGVLGPENVPRLDLQPPNSQRRYRTYQMHYLAAGHTDMVPLLIGKMAINLIEMDLRGSLQHHWHSFGSAGIDESTISQHSTSKYLGALYRSRSPPHLNAAQQSETHLTPTNYTQV
jgi:hypothetical protein